MTRPTIHTVAALAGVSIKTVSRVLNGGRHVAGETQARVQAAVTALSFQPSAAAQALGGGRSRIVVLLCDNPNPHFLFEMQAGALAACRPARHQLIVQPYDRSTGGLADEVADMVDPLRPHGVILTPPASDDARLIALLLERQVPFVRVSPSEPSDVSSSVRIDNEAAAHAAVTHLLDGGHRRIGLITGPPDYPISHRRTAGARRAIAERALPWDEALVVPGHFDAASGRHGAAALLALARPPSAIFAANDDMAAGVLALAHERGLTLPGDLSVVGFDRTDVAALVWPPLTTVAQPFRDLGREAAALLVRPHGAIEHLILPTSLWIGGSTAAKANH